MTLEDIPGFAGLTPDRQARVRRGMTDQAYFQGRVTTLLEVLDRAHTECKAERIGNEDTLFKAVRALQLTRAKLLGWIAGASAVAALLAIVAEKLLAHLAGATP
jgi:hypothetical protein